MTLRYARLKSIAKLAVDEPKYGVRNWLRYGTRAAAGAGGPQQLPFRRPPLLPIRAAQPQAIVTFWKLLPTGKISKRRQVERDLQRS